MSNKTLRVKWLVADKRLIKFFELNDSYNVAEDVVLDAIDTNVEVTAEIKDNVVVKLDVQEEKESKKKETKTEPPKEAEPTEENPTPQDVQPEEDKKKETQTVTWTIRHTTSDKSVMRFEEQPVLDYWYPIEEKIMPKFQPLNKGDKVTIVIGKVMATSRKNERYEKDGIIELKSSEKVEKEEEPSKEPEAKKEAKKPFNSTSNSIERQVAIKEAGAIVRSLIEQDKTNEIGMAQIEEYLTKFTQVCLKAMRDA